MVGYADGVYPIVMEVRRRYLDSAAYPIGIPIDSVTYHGAAT